MNELIIVTAKYAFLVSLFSYLAYAVLLWRRNKKRLKGVILLSVFSFPLAFLIAKLASLLIYDPRPFIVDHVAPLISHTGDNGFPSDHTLLTTAIASVVFVYNKKLGSILFMIALCVGIARVLAHVHHPLDIIGAIVIAMCATYFVYVLRKRFRSVWQ